MNFKRYKTFSTEDFVLDDDFRRMVAGKLDSHHSPERLKEKFPQKIKQIDLAITIVKALRTTENEQPVTQKMNLWGKIISEQSRQVRLKVFKYAAALILLIGVGSSALYLYLYQKQPVINEFASSLEISSDDIALILSDGEQIDIDSEQAEIQYHKDGTSVLVNDTTSLKQMNITSGFNRMIVPYGKHSTVKLSDGTRVWLNSGSKLVYAPVFKEKIREVFLEGEAYFEVAENANKPFYVRTDAFSVKVIGTKFDVKAYKDDKEYYTVLVEGKVGLKVNDKLFSKEVLLSPNEKSTLKKNHDEFQIASVDNVNFYTSWIHGYLEFENENVKDMLQRISRYYNIEIELKTNDQLKKISGKLDLKTDPERILSGFARLSNTRFMMEDNKYIFYE